MIVRIATHAVIATLLLGLWACGGSAPRVDGPSGGVLASGVRLDVQWRVPLEPDGGSFVDGYRWRPRELGGVAVAPSRGVVAFATRAGELRGLDVQTGNTLWSLDLVDAPMAAPVEIDGVFYLAHVDGTLRAIDARSGGVEWTFRTGTVLTGEPGVGPSHVGVVGADDTLYVVDRATGTLRWRFERPLTGDLTVEGAGTPVFIDDAIYAGFADGTLGRFNLDGSTRWLADLAGGERRLTDVDGMPLVRGDVVFASSYSSGVYALNAITGERIWTVPIRGATSPVAAGDRVVVGSTDGVVYWLDPETGDELASLEIDEDGGTTDATSIGGTLVFGSINRGLAVVDAFEPWLYNRFSPGSGVSAAAAAGPGAIYVLTNLGYAYRIDAWSTGAVR